MKAFILLSLLIFSAGVFAKADVYCKDNGRVINILSEDYFDCQGYLLMGAVCFTGNRGEAIKILNSQEVRNMFDGTDGEFIENAHYMGRDEISYTVQDLANEWSDKVSIKRCSASFFRN